MTGMGSIRHVRESGIRSQSEQELRADRVENGVLYETVIQFDRHSYQENIIINPKTNKWDVSGIDKVNYGLSIDVHGASREPIL